MIDYVEPPPESSPPAVTLALELLRLRRRIAPSGTLRHRFLRFLYKPLIQYLRDRDLTKRLQELPQPAVVAAHSLKKRADKWPLRPRILLLKLDHLGDFVVALPAMARIRGAFPNAIITLVCANWNKAWAERSGLFDTVLTFDFFAATKSEFGGISQAHFERFALLQLGDFDLAIDLRHDPDTRALLELVNADIRVGFAAPSKRGGERLDIALPDMEHISRAAGTGRPVHAELRLNLLAAAVIDTFVTTTHPLHTMMKQPGVRLPDRPFAILAPGAGSPIRIWPVRRLAAVGRELIARHGFDIVLIGSNAQRDDCIIMSRDLPMNRVYNLAGRSTIDDLPSIVDRAALFVGYDSGTSHIAASLGIPTVSIMGAIGNPEVWRIHGPHAIALTSDIECASCYLNDSKECPIAVRCLTDITVNHVLDACETVLESHSQRQVECTSESVVSLTSIAK
jgi:ADP-heptose:LPS heptosyltransferase